MTLGHLDVIRRAAALYDEVVVAVLHNVAKKGLFTPQERLEMIRAEVQDAGLGNVRTCLLYTSRCV